MPVWKYLSAGHQISRLMRYSMLCIIGVAVPTLQEAAAQSAIEHHVWQDQRTFEPLSRTASAITGTITLSGNDRFAQPGSEMGIEFGTGAAARLTSVGASWREWSLGGEKKTAEVFRMSADPGPLANGNTLCGGVATYVTFYEDTMMGGTSVLEMAIFEGADPPFDINSNGLCGTFSYLY